MTEVSPYISVVVPVYGCRDFLVALCDRLEKSLSTMSANYEIILVNDASPDLAWEAIKEISEKKSKVKGLNLSRNFGQHYAISAGLDFASGDYIVIMDCDLQDRPEDIPSLYKKATEGFEVVYGYSSFRGKKSILRSFSRNLYIFLYDLLVQTNYKSVNLSFFLITKQVRDAIVQYRENARHISSIVREVGFKITGVEVVHLEREAGKSSYNFSKRLKLALVGIVTYSTILLNISLFFGFSFSILALLFAVVIVYKKIFEINYSAGWTSLAVLILFFSGLILLFIGVLGIYIEKIFVEVKDRPLYIVSEKINL